VLNTTSPTEQPSAPIDMPLNTEPSSSTNNADLVKHVTSNVQNGMTLWIHPAIKNLITTLYKIILLWSLTIFATRSHQPDQNQGIVNYYRVLIFICLKYKAKNLKPIEN
jgi:hypothetical protein